MNDSQDFSPVGIVSGSGIELESLLDPVKDELSFAEVPGLLEGTVLGHEHRFLKGFCGGVPVILQCGRLHMYEGFDYETVVKPVDVMAEWGVRKLIFTCAAGGLVLGMAPGDLMAVERVRLWRYKAWPVTPGMLYTDFQTPGCAFTGTYQWMHGPCYETRAEIKALQQMQVSAVGMSTAPELMRAQELGIQSAMIACITNSCTTPHVLTHEDVCAVARKSSQTVRLLLRKAIARA